MALELTEAQRELLVMELMEKENVKNLYELYIVKTIPFEDWVRNSVDALLNPKPVNVDAFIEEIMKEGDL